MVSPRTTNQTSVQPQGQSTNKQHSSEEGSGKATCASNLVRVQLVVLGLLVLGRVEVLERLVLQDGSGELALLAVAAGPFRLALVVALASVRIRVPALLAAREVLDAIRVAFSLSQMSVNHLLKFLQKKVGQTHKEVVPDRLLTRVLASHAPGDRLLAVALGHCLL